MGRTPLHWAADKNSIEIALSLLQANANPHIKDNVRDLNLDILLMSATHCDQIGWNGRSSLGCREEQY
jgi:ankyrin repeat protein